MFYASILVLDSDNDFTIFFNKKIPLRDGGVVWAQGETPEAAWQALIDSYQVSAAYGTFSPKETLDAMAYRHVHFLTDMLTVTIPKYIKNRGGNLDGDVQESINAKGCFCTCFDGNWDIEIRVSEEQPSGGMNEIGERLIPHGEYTVALCPNGDIKIRYKGQDIIWLDTYYQRPEGQGHTDAGIVGLPCVLLNAVNNDNPAVSASIGDDKVLINDIDKEQVEGL